MHSLSCVFSVSSLKCITCASYESWEECAEVSTPCGLTLADQCVKLYYKVGSVKTFMKMCGSDAYCYEKTNPFCNDARGSFGCTIYCCKGDNCNAGAATRISGILLLSCALASLMMFFKAWDLTEVEVEVQHSSWLRLQLVIRFFEVCQ